MRANKNQGFLLISLILVLAIIAIIFVISMRGKGGSTANVVQTGKQAEDSLKSSNQKMLQEQIDAQNQLNSK